MKKIIAFSVEHPVSVLMMVLTVLLLGLLSSFLISVDFLPVLSSRRLLVATEYTGISAEEMESMVTVPLEDAFASLNGLKKIESVTRDGLSLISIELHWGTDSDMALIESREIIDTSFVKLPSNCDKPTVFKNDSSNDDTVTIIILPKDSDLQYARYIAEKDMKPRFQRLQGVASVTVDGGEKEQIEVCLSREKLESRNLDLQSISSIITSANFEYPAGTIHEGEKDILVKTSGLFHHLSELTEIPVLYEDSGLLRLGDIASVHRSHEEKETFCMLDGQECIQIGILKKTDASPLSVSRLVREEMQRIRAIYGDAYQLTITDDLSLQVYDSLKSLLIAAAVSLVVTFLIILFFLQSGKISAIVAGIIPVSTAAAVFMLFACGKTINIMSLSGIAIAIGMVVDSSSVVVENIQKKILHAVKNDNTGQEYIRELIVSGTGDVLMSNIGSSLTTGIVFLPVFFLKSLLGELFIDMAIAIVTAILFSCLLSFTYVPAMLRLLSGRLCEPGRKQGNLRKLQSVYVYILRKIMKRKAVIIIPIAAACAIGIISLYFLDFEMLPSLKTNKVAAEIRFPPGTSISRMQETAAELAELIADSESIQSISISGGVESDDYISLSDPAVVEEHIILNIKTDQPEKVRTLIADLIGDSQLSVTFPQVQNLLSSILQVADNVYVIQAADRNELDENAAVYADEGAECIPDEKNREYVFKPDRIASARFSVSAVYTVSLARNTLEGLYTAPFYEDGREIPVLVKIDEDDISSITDLENIGVLLESDFVPLSALGSIHEEVHEKILYRYNRKYAKRIIPVQPFSVQEGDAGITDLRNTELREMLGDGVFLIVIVLLLLYLVMGAQFESCKIPVVLLFSLLPAFSGAFLFLAVFGKTVNVNSIIALVVLFGLAVNNAVLLYENCLSAGKTTERSVIVLCAEKLRAVCITTFTSIFAMIPFAIDPAGKSSQSALSVAIIGGLLFSMMLVLFVLPVFLLRFMKKKGYRQQ